MHKIETKQLEIKILPFTDNDYSDILKTFHTQYVIDILNKKSYDYSDLKKISHNRFRFYYLIIPVGNIYETPTIQVENSGKKHFIISNAAFSNLRRFIKLSDTTFPLFKIRDTLLNYKISFDIITVKTKNQNFIVFRWSQ